jgi:nitroreductase
MLHLPTTKVHRSMSLPDATALIRNRRSLKPSEMDSQRQIERPLLETVLENATWAPSHGLTEPWRFTVFQDAARSALATQLQTIYRAVTPPTELREDKVHKLGLNPLLAPVVIAVSMERRGGQKIPELEEVEAVACGVQNLLLSASAAGVGSFWSSPALLDSSQWKAFLGLRDCDRCLGLIYLGWPKVGRPMPSSSRRPLSQCVTWRSES